jgi:hypothetical protein
MDAIHSVQVHQLVVMDANLDALESVQVVLVRVHILDVAQHVLGVNFSVRHLVQRIARVVIVYAQGVYHHALIHVLARA